MPHIDGEDDPAPGTPAPHRSWLTGVWGNSLARSADRWHAGLRLLLIWVWMLALPLAATAGSLIGSDALQAAKDQAHQRTATTALLTADASPVTYTAGGVPILSTAQVAAQWIAPNGSMQTGTVAAQAGALTGAKVPIWVDRSGAVVGAPISTTEALGVGLLVGLGSWLALGCLLALTMQLTVVALDRGRRADWDRDWARVAPLWQGQQ